MKTINKLITLLVACGTLALPMQTARGATYVERAPTLYPAFDPAPTWELGASEDLNMRPYAAAVPLRYRAHGVAFWAQAYNYDDHTYGTIQFDFELSHDGTTWSTTGPRAVCTITAVTGRQTHSLWVNLTRQQIRGHRYIRLARTVTSLAGTEDPTYMTNIFFAFGN